MTAFLGDHPVRVIVRLLLVSLLVGWVLRWLDLSLAELGSWAVARLNDVLGLGLDAASRFGDTVLLGAAVVVPVFLISRLVSARRR